MAGRTRLGGFVPSDARKVVRRGRKARRLGPRRAPDGDWRVATDGRAPRLGAREFIGHDVRGSGPLEDRDPLRVPALWSRASWSAFVGWALTLGGSGWMAWRRHGGKDAFRS